MARAHYHHGDLRRALIDATLELLGEGDVAQISLRSVARRAGVSSGAPYHHFPDKPALLAEVALQGWVQLNHALDAATPATADLGEVLRCRARAYLRFGIGHPGHYRVLFRRDLKDPERFGALHDSSGQAIEGLKAMLGHVRGLPADHPQVVSRALAAWSLLHGFVTLWNDGVLQGKEHAPPLDALLDETAAAAVRAAMG